MPAIKERTAIQYTAQDGVSPQADGVGYQNRGSTLSGYVGGASTHLYRQVDIGKGSRVDFTKINDVEGKSEPKYDHDKFGSIKYDISMYKARGTQKA